MRRLPKAKVPSLNFLVEITKILILKLTFYDVGCRSIACMANVMALEVFQLFLSLLLAFVVVWEEFLTRNLS